MIKRSVLIQTNFECDHNKFKLLRNKVKNIFVVIPNLNIFTRYFVMGRLLLRCDNFPSFSVMPPRSLASRLLLPWSSTYFFASYASLPPNFDQFDVANLFVDSVFHRNPNDKFYLN